nr:zinc finger protein [Hymenolepis microstoma]
MAENTPCGICMLPLLGTTGSPLTCGHKFHFGCLNSWSMNNSNGGRCKCPLATCDQIYMCMEVKTTIVGSKPQYFPVEVNYPCNSCSGFVKSPALSINGCDHYFCYRCISRLMDNEHTCPVDKSAFTDIKVATCVGAPPVATIPLDVPQGSISRDDLLNIFWSLS